MIKYTSKGMIKQVKNEKIQQNTLFLETAESPLTTFSQIISLNQKTPINGSLLIGIAKAHTS